MTRLALRLTEKDVTLTSANSVMPVCLMDMLDFATEVPKMTSNLEWVQSRIQGKPNSNTGCIMDYHKGSDCIE